MGYSTQTEPVAPYKVEPTKCGCGRSPSGYCVGLHRLSDAEWAAQQPAPVVSVESPVVPAVVAKAKVAKVKAPKATPVAKAPKTKAPKQ